MSLPWSFKRNFLGAKEIKDTNDYLSKVGRAIGSLDYMPVGFSMPWWSDTLPSSKYMFMEGQPLANYPEAKAVFGDSLPDLRGRVMVHKSTDAEFDAIKETGGEKKHALTIDEMPSHGHSLTHMNGGGNDGVVYSGGPSGATFGFTPDQINASTGIYPFTTNNTGSNGAHNNLQPYIVCRYIAKVLP